MADYTSRDIRNVVLVSHAGAGKTTLAEALLFDAEATGRLGKVDNGSSLSDYRADEIERKISIQAGYGFCDYQGKRIYLLDTPGYADFIGETIGPLAVADAGIIVVCAVSGIEVGADKMWKLFEAQGKPRAIFINKTDKENADFKKVYEAIKARWGKKCAAMGVDEYKNDLVEAVAEGDDALLEKYLDGQELTDEEIKTGLKKLIATGNIVPVLSGSALGDKGTRELLNLIATSFPSPLDAAPAKATKDGAEEEIEVKPDDEQFSAQVFKSLSDPFVGQLTIFRVRSGKLSADTGFYNATRESKERIGPLYCLKGKEQVPQKGAIAGDIIAVTKLKNTKTGDSIGTDKNKLIFPALVFPEPVISASVKPHSRGDEEKISGALTKLVAEDATFKISRDQQTKELIISGMGDLHLDIMVDRLRNEFHVQIDLGVPKVAYKETITKKVEVQGKHKKQSGGRGQYGDVWLRIEPLAHGEDFEFANEVVGGSVPRNYIPAVEKGVRAAMSEGALAGYPIVGFKATIYDGSYHNVDSSDLAFQIAGSQAVKKGVLQAGPVLLEPIMDVEVVIPEDAMGSVNGDLNSRRGRIMGMDTSGDYQVIKAQVPLAEVLKYASDLRSMTQGQGSYSMKFSHYEAVPGKLAQAIIDQSKKVEEEVESEK